MGNELGAVHKAAIKKQTNPWGGAALQFGAGDGFEFNSDTLKSNAEMIMNNGITGSPFKRCGSAGPRKPNGDMSFDLYYKCSSWRQLAAGFGASAHSTLSAGVYQQDLTVPVSPFTLPIFGLGLLGVELVREVPTLKVSAIKLDWSEADQRGKASFSFVGHDVENNVGSPDADLVVATAAAANGAAAIAAQPPFPSRITFTATGVTELVTTLVGVDIDGVQRTEVHTVSTDGLTFLSTHIYRSVTSVTEASIAGAGNFSAGVQNGVNNQGTIAAVTTDADRTEILFSQMEFFINAQDGADFVAGDEQYLSKISLGIELGLDSRVTTEFGNRVSEPSFAGSGDTKVTFGASFSAFGSRERRHIFDSLGKKQLKAKLVFTGPPITGTATPNSLTIWLNGIQLADGADINVGGFGLLTYDLAGEAHTVLAAPTGFPAGLVAPIMGRLVNGQATSYLA